MSDPPGTSRSGATAPSVFPDVWVAGLVHGFRNIFTAIAGHAALGLACRGLDERAKAAFHEIQRAVGLAQDLTSRLLDLAQSRMQEPAPCQLNDVVRQVVDLIRPLIPPTTRLEVRLEPHLPQVLADASLLAQVLLDLCLNARDAIGKAGVIRIRTSNARSRQPTGPVGPVAAAGGVCLTVSDSGAGIPAERLARIFEPFFTTKPRGRGTGLGLAAVKRIVEMHHGSIDVRSRPGQGTQFRIRLSGLWPPSEDTVSGAG